MKKENEPKWIQDLANSLLRQPTESYGDEDQNDNMQLIIENDDDQL